MKKLIFLFVLFTASMSLFAQDKLPLTEATEIGKSGCINKISFRQKDQMIIQSEAELSEAIRNDASRERCTAFFQEQNISFHTHVLVGAGIHSGSCRRPAQLDAELQTDYTESKAEVVISYDVAQLKCKAYYIYPAWYLVPKPPEGFTVNLKIVETENKEILEF